MKIAFASCMDAMRVPKQPVWTAIQNEDPDVLMLLGDQIYMDWGDLGESNWKQLIDVPGKKGEKALEVFAQEMHSRYAQQWSVTEFQKLVCSNNLTTGARRTLLMTWDDHDFAWNNSIGVDTETVGGAAPRPAYHGVPQRVKVVSLRLFRQFEHHLITAALGTSYPAFDPTVTTSPPVETNGIERFGQVTALGQTLDYALLDTRWYRTSRSHDSRTILGANQLATLQALFAAPKQGLLIIGAGAPPKYRYTVSRQAWVGGTEPPYPEFEQLIQMANTGTRPVLFLTGDVHRNVWSGALKTANANPTKIVQVISSGAAIDKIFGKKTLPSYGIVKLGLGSASVEAQLITLAEATNTPVLDPSALPLKLNALNWNAATNWVAVPDGEAANNTPYVDPANLNDLEPIALMVLRPRQPNAWPTAIISEPFGNAKALDAAFQHELLGLNPDSYEVNAIAATVADPAKIQIRHTGNTNSEDDREAKLQELIEAAFLRAQARPTTCPVVLFIHGTANSIAKTIDQCYALRAVYQCEPIALAWPAGSSRGGISAVIGASTARLSAEASGKHFQKILHIFNLVAQSYPAITSIVLVRSAASLMYESALGFIGADPGRRKKAFSHISRVVLSAPITKANDLNRLYVGGGNHGAEWNLPPTFVTINQNDQTLKFANFIDFLGQMLGKELPAVGNLAKTVVYLEYKNVGRSHDYIFSLYSGSTEKVNKLLISNQPFNATNWGVTAQPSLNNQVFSVT